MSIALATVIFVLIFLPGYSFRLFYLRPIGPQLRRIVRLEEIIPTNPLKAIAYAIILSFPIHFSFLAAIYDLVETSVDYHQLFALLTGEFGQNSQLLEPITANFETNLSSIFFYFLTIIIVAGVAGFISGILRWSFIEPWLNGKGIQTINNIWFYKFPMGQNVIIRIEALSQIGMGQTTNILYRGILAEYTTDREGNLQQLFLTPAQRGVFDGNFEFREIAGDVFVINYEEIKNLNVTYFEIEEAV